MQNVIYIDRVEPNWDFRVVRRMGTLVPFLRTASGKLFMSSLSSAQSRPMVEALSLDALTPKTHSSPDTLDRKLTLIRRDGFNPDHEEYHLGMVAISVPVTGAKGQF